MADSRISIDENNQFFWNFSGEFTLLLGATDQDNLFQWPDNKLQEHLDEMKESGGNYVRNTMSDRESEGFEVYPVKEVEDGKYDLTEWNPEYWKRFENFLQETATRNIVVQIEIWDTWDTAKSPFDSENFWEPHPYNPKNNINYTRKKTGLPKEWAYHPMSRDHPFYLAAPPLNDISPVFEYQKSFVEKILSHTLQHNHVLYTVCNETRLPERFSIFWAEFLHNKTGSENEEIFVSDMRGRETSEPILTHPDLFNYAELSQAGENHGEGHYESLRRERSRLSGNPSPLNNVKQYGSDEENGDFYGGEEEVLRKFWRSLFAGCASFRFHRPTFGIGLSEEAKQMIQSARILESEVDLVQYRPDNSVLEAREIDEAYALVSPSSYLVYFPWGGSVTLPTAEDGLGVEWLDIEEGGWTDDSESLPELDTPDDSSQWVAVVR